jgi:uncharacterized protein YcbX
LAVQHIHITNLAIYPVKSLRGIELQDMSVGALGPLGDRRFVIADSKRRFITQRQISRMCLVDVEWNGERLQLQAPGCAELSVAVSQAVGARTPVMVWRDTVDACDMGDAAAVWLSAYLGIAARLYFMPDDSIRAVDPMYARAGDRVGFADGFPLLLIAQASLAAINSELSEAIGADRFRPNIVVSGSTAYAEDEWRRIRIGAIEFEVVKPCSRCAIPSIDIATAQRQPIVAQTLARLRQRGDAVYFGQNLIQRGEGRIAVGDIVTVLE